MDAENETTIEGRVARAQRDAAQRRQKLFVRFAVVEALVLVLAVLAVYVLKVIDPEIGLFLIVGVVVVAGAVLTMLVLREMKRAQREIAEARGETPGVW